LSAPKHVGQQSPPSSRLAAFAKAALTQQWSVLAFLIVSFIIAQTIVLALHFRTTQMDRDVQEIQLARDLYREFYAGDRDYLRIANAIEACDKLYKSDGGKFSHLQINEYLGFFSDLGLFMQRGSLSPELIGHFFGAYVVEAYEYPEIQSYIERVRRNFNQPEAFAGFEAVAQAMVKDPRFASLVSLAKTMCQGQGKETSSP
jgi:hypothetical protein